MTDRVERARAELAAATDTATRDVREQLHSIDEGLAELVDGDATRESELHEDRLVEVVEKLDGLREEADGETSAHVADARELLADAGADGRAA